MMPSRPPASALKRCIFKSVWRAITFASSPFKLPMASTWLPPWFDGFFLSMLATSVIVVSVNWERYNKCTYPLHIWIVVDYAVVFLFRVFMFINRGLALGMGPEATYEDRLSRFKGRIFVITCLTFVLYPFLWAWTIVGSLWFTDADKCLPEEGQKWGFLIWLIFSYCGLICVACISVGKWLLGRQARLQIVSTPVSEFEIIFELIRVPNWAFLSVDPAQDNVIGHGGHDFISYHPGVYMSPTQREQIDKLIQELPTFRLKGVPTESNACPICLDEFEIGTEVRGLPCAHNFHISCIDAWLRLNVKCPHCRCSVFPELSFPVGSPSSSPYQGHSTNPPGNTTAEVDVSQGNDHNTHSSETLSSQINPLGGSSMSMEETRDIHNNNIESLVVTVDRSSTEHM